MWIFSPECGFLSVVCARKGNGEPGKGLDPERVMVRARNIQHLRALQERHESLRALEILETPSADYPARIVVDKELWAAVLTDMASAIDYGNFKAADASGRGNPDPAYAHALHVIWAQMCEYQEEVRRDPE